MDRPFLKLPTLYSVAFTQRNVALLKVAFNVTQSNIATIETNKQFLEGYPHPPLPPLPTDIPHI